MPIISHHLAFFDLGAGETMLIMLMVLIFFGGEKLPGFARGLGKAVREFKKASSGVEEEIRRAMAEPPPKPPAPVRPELGSAPVPDLIELEPAASEVPPSVPEVAAEAGGPADSTAQAGSPDATPRPSVEVTPVDKPKPTS